LHVAAHFGIALLLTDPLAHAAELRNGKPSSWITIRPARFFQKAYAVINSQSQDDVSGFGISAPQVSDDSHSHHQQTAARQRLYS